MNKGQDVWWCKAAKNLDTAIWIKPKQMFLFCKGENFLRKQHYKLIGKDNFFIFLEVYLLKSE